MTEPGMNQDDEEQSGGDAGVSDEAPRASVYSPDAVLGPGEVMVLDDDGDA